MKLYGQVICIMQTSYHQTFLKVVDSERCNVSSYDNGNTFILFISKN